MASDDQPLRYCAYVLRCWEERGQQEARPSLWRFSLEDASTGKRRGFASLDALVAALQRELVADYASLSPDLLLDAAALRGNEDGQQ